MRLRKPQVPTMVLALSCLALSAGAAGATESTVLTIPTAASIVGMNGNAFRSDLWLLNRSNLMPATARLSYQCLRGLSCTPATKTVTLAPRQSVVLEDVVATLFDARGTAGPLVVSFEAGTPVSVASRVTTTSGAGTFGTSVPALPPEAARISAVFVGLASSGGDPSRGARSNAGVYNPSPQPADVTLTLEDERGTPLGSTALKLAGFEAIQVYPNVFEAVGAPPVVTRNAVLLVTATAPVFSYVTVIDNASGDSAFLTADPDDDHDVGPIAGAWTGTFVPWDFIDCDQTPTPATATFEQDGENVVGVMDTRANGCGFPDGVFKGVLRGGALTGTATGGWLSSFGPSSVTGTLSGSSLRIEVQVPCPGELCIPGGRLVLHR